MEKPHAQHRAKGERTLPKLPEHQHVHEWLDAGASRLQQMAADRRSRHDKRERGDEGHGWAKRETPVQRRDEPDGHENVHQDERHSHQGD